MSRISKTFADGQKKLITFIMAGDPDHETSLAILKSLPEAGADIIELGMPFTDPVADGPTIQAAGLRALAAGASMKNTLELVKAFRKENDTIPIVLMGYANPIMAYGWENFAKDASLAGVDGLIIVDLPPEEDRNFRTICFENKIDLIRLITPTSDEARLPVLLEGVSGFLYYVSIAGITGSASANPQTLAPHIEQIRKLTGLPLAIGFGIRSPEDAQTMATIGDAIVVGSALIRNIEENPQTAADKIKIQIQTLKNAL
ncbi:MAG: tryptophan synthase subunit alpha [Alphaproteobacteria bacterium]|nr:tryptophan synthase subunit alpha [Alphaproteobacteria bacterium]